MYTTVVSEPVNGMPWYRSKDYPSLLNIFEDSDAFPRTWVEWVDVAEAKVKYFESMGKRVMRVPIPPHEFARWCAANGHKANAAGRRAFVANKLARMRSSSTKS